LTRLLIALLIALTASVLCAGPASRGPAYAASAATPVDATSEATTPQFVDIARLAGVIFHHTNGASPGKHLAETMGAGGVTTSYFEWVQDRYGYFWDLSEVNERLEKKMCQAFDSVLQTSLKYKVDLRTAAYIVAISRVGAVTKLRGMYA